MTDQPPPPEEIVLYEKDPSTKIATITLNRPGFLNAPTIAALRSARTGPSHGQGRRSMTLPVLSDEDIEALATLTADLDFTDAERGRGSGDDGARSTR